MKNITRVLSITGLAVCCLTHSGSASIWFSDDTARIVLAGANSQLTVPASTMVYQDQSIIKKKGLVAFGHQTETYVTASQDLLYSTSDAVVYWANKLTATVNDIYVQIGNTGSGLTSRVTALETGLTNTYSYLYNLIDTDSNAINLRITQTMDDVHERIDGIETGGVEARVSALEVGLASTYGYLYELIDTNTQALDDRITETMDNVYERIDGLDFNGLDRRLTALDTHLNQTADYLYTLIISDSVYLDNRITETMNDAHRRLDSMDPSSLNARLDVDEANLTNTYNYLYNLLDTDTNALNLRITQTMDDAHHRLDGIEPAPVEARLTVDEANLTSTYNYLGAQIAPVDADAKAALALAQQAKLSADQAQVAGEQDIFRGALDMPEVLENASGEVVINNKVACLVSVDPVKPLLVKLNNGAILCSLTPDIVLKPEDEIIVVGKNNMISVLKDFELQGKLVLEEGAKLFLAASENATSSVFHFAPHSSLVIKKKACLERVGNCAVAIDSTCVVDSDALKLNQVASEVTK